MLSWNYFAYTLTILFVLFQQVGLDYFTSKVDYTFMSLVVLLDVLVLVFFLFNHDVDYAATRGGNCWAVYTWAITVKLVLMYFTIISDELQGPGVLIHQTRGAATEVELLLLIAPIVYALLCFRGYDELFGGVNIISTESMLHGDLVLHVMLDWWDIVAAFSTFIYFPPMMQQECHWLHISVGVVICVAIFLHAYSFPTLGDATTGGQRTTHDNANAAAAAAAAAANAASPTPGGTNSAADGGGSVSAAAAAAAAARTAASSSSTNSTEMDALLRDAGDVFVTRKHAALVGICIVDVPLMVFRIYLWVSYPTFVGFSPFIVKNITSIMMQGMRIWQVITASKLKFESLKGREMRRKHVRDNTTTTTTLHHHVVDDSSGSYPPHFGSIAAAAAALPGGGDGPAAAEHKKVKFATDPVTFENPRAAAGDLLNLYLLPTPLLSTTHRKSIGMGGGGVGDIDTRSDETMFYNDDISDEERTNQDQKELETLVQNVLSVKAPRTLPGDPVRHRQLARKIIHCARLGGRHSLAVLLDNVLHIPFWKLFRLAFPFMLMWLFQIAIVAILFFVNEDRLGDETKPSVKTFPVQLFDTRILSSPQLKLNIIPTEISIGLIVVSAMMGSSFALWIFSVPFLDVLLVSVFSTVQLFSFFLLVLSFRDFRVFYDIFSIESTFGVKHIDTYFLWLFAIEPVVGVLYTLYPFFCVLLDKQYLGYVVPLPNAATFLSKVSNVAWGLSTGVRMTSGYPPDRQYMRSWDTEDAEFADSQMKRGDEVGLMTISSLVVFLNCRFSVAPISLHELLIGPDLVKSFRLTDALLHSHFRYLCVASVLRLWTTTLFISFPDTLAYSKNEKFTNLVRQSLLSTQIGVEPFAKLGYKFNVIIMVFVIHLVLLVVHLIFSQVVRLLTIRRYETKAMFEEIAEVMRRASKKEESNNHSENDVNEFFVETEIDLIIEKYKLHGFYTTPGDILPIFF